MLAEVEESPWWETFAMWAFLWNMDCGIGSLLPTNTGRRNMHRIKVCTFLPCGQDPWRQPSSPPVLGSFSGMKSQMFD